MKAGNHQAPRGSRLSLALPEGFDLTTAVCSYGFFLLAPTRWESDTRTLTLPLRGQGDRIIRVNVRQSADRKSLTIACDEKVSPEEAAKLRAALARILRLGEDFTGWFKLHLRARREGFGRLFRGASFFEDAVKTMTTCNVAWTNTVRMNALLCEHVGGGAFPTPAQVARWRADRLKLRCRVGYRAPWILQLARRIDRGELDPAWFETPARPIDELYDALRAIHGLGEYAAHNMLQLLGRYERVPVDSETARHFRDVHGLALPDNSRQRRDMAQRQYQAYAPYQFLAYWYELKDGYEAKAGPAETWPQADMAAFTSRGGGKEG